jgi:hypothetical protein
MKSAKSLGSVGKPKQEVLQFGITQNNLELNKIKLPPNTCNYNDRE